MSCTKPLQRIRQTIVVTSTTAMFFPGTDFMPITSMDAANFLGNLLSLEGPGEYKPGAQLAVVRTDRPSAPAAITAGSYTSALGFTQFRESPIGGANSAFIRFGTMARLQSGQSGQAVLLLD